MILQPQHDHEEAPPEPAKLSLPPPVHKQPPSGKTPNECPRPTKQQSQPGPEIMMLMLENSLGLLSGKGSKQVREKMRYRQEKVHLYFAKGAYEYLDHLASKLHPENHDTLKEMIELQNWVAADNIRSGQTRLEPRPGVSALNGAISGKLSEMKQSMRSLSSMDKRAEAYISNLLQFKKKNYWLEQTESKVKVRTFLTKMKRIQSEQKKRLEQSMVQQQSQMMVSQEREVSLREEARKQAYGKELQKQASWRQHRQRSVEQDRQKKQEIETMLNKYHTSKPVHLRMEQSFRKSVLEPMEEERQKKLEAIRQQHQPIDPEELEEHNQRYQEYKESLVEQHRKKEEEWQDMNGKLEQELKELYHGKFHQDIEPRFYNSVHLGKVEARRKVKDYEQVVLEKFKPSVDEGKRMKVKEHILDLELKEDKRKRKVVREDGSVEVEQRPEFDARRIGVGYLQQLREDNEGKPRKADRSSSLMEVSVSSQVKRIDYLRENKPQVKLKKSSSQWKKIVGDSSYSPKQKYDSIMEQAAVLEEKSRQKELQMRSYKRGERAIELSEEMDSYYAQSVSARMMVLKDVIMKQ